LGDRARWAHDVGAPAAGEDALTRLAADVDMLRAELGALHLAVTGLAQLLVRGTIPQVPQVPLPPVAWDPPRSAEPTVIDIAALERAAA